MRSAILGFAAGAAWLQASASLPGMGTLCVLAAIALVLLAATRGALRAAAAGALLGFCWAALLAQHALAPALAKVDEGRDITVVGVVDSMPYRFAQGVRFGFAVEKVLAGRGAGPAVVPPHVALSWYGGQRGGGEPGDVRPGERWQLTVRLQRPHGNANPGGFDYEVWLLEQGIRATGYVRPQGARRLAGFVPGFGNVVERCRALLRDRILAALPGKEYAGVIVALVIGDQRGIDQAGWAVFTRTGTSHLISISGLHITMVAGLAAWAVAALWRRSFFTRAELPLLLPAQKAAAAAAAGVALLYVLLAGFGVPAQRTLYMVSVVALSLWTGRITSVSYVLCAALGIVVLLDPWAMLWPGFWLSFGAVAAILYAGTGRIGAAPGGLRGMLAPALRTQYAVTLGLVPLTLLLFGQVSLASPLANAVAIPVVSFIVTPLALAGSLLPAPLSGVLLQAAHFAVAQLAHLLAWMSAQPLAVWAAPQPPAWLFLLALAGTAWMLAPRGWPHRWAGAAAWLPLFTLMPAHPQTGGFEVTAFDVGQGMALLVETRGHRLLYDTGPAYAPDSDAGGRVILPYLKARGIGALDGLIVTHSDTDHSGGALTLMQALPVGWVASSLGPGHPVVRAARRHVRCVAGQHWRWDGVDFEMLQPGAASYADASLKPNARGCTLRIAGAHRSMLLAADIEAAQEQALVAGSMRPLLAADVLLAPHHGSGTSSTPAFLLAVHPSLAVFQVGYRNRYHHPKRQVLERYAAMGIRRLRTDESGAVALSFGDVVAIHEYRSEHARYWYGR